MTYVSQLAKKLKTSRLVIYSIMRAHSNIKRLKGKVKRSSLKMDTESKRIIRKLSKTLKVSQNAVVKGLIKSASIKKS